MIRYVLAALALKAFSANDATRGAYRRFGNALGARSRARADLGTYIRRGDLLVDLYRRHSPLPPGTRVLELGTGWMHWYGIYLRLHNDIRVTTLDVWDNRQFDALQSCFARLRANRPSAPMLLDTILNARNFDELYDAIELDHHIVPDGSLARFDDDTFDSVCSMHVLEHVARDAVPGLLREMFRTLKPGRIVVHQIGLADHISAQYDRSVSMKQYVTYPAHVWKRWFENDLQYINLMQPADWLSAFAQAGFDLIEQIRQSVDISQLKISPDFANYSPEDLACTNLTVVFRKR